MVARSPWSLARPGQEKSERPACPGRSLALVDSLPWSMFRHGQEKRRASGLPALVKRRASDQGERPAPWSMIRAGERRATRGEKSERPAPWSMAGERPAHSFALVETSTRARREERAACPGRNIDQGSATNYSSQSESTVYSE